MTRRRRSHKTDDGKPAPIEAMLRFQIKHCETFVAKQAETRAAFTRAIEMLTSWTFERDLPHNSSQQQQSLYLSILNTYGSTSTFTRSWG